MNKIERFFLFLYIFFVNQSYFSFSRIFKEDVSGVLPPVFPKLQYNALFALYNSTNGNDWAWSTSTSEIPWNFSNPASNPCLENWQGVICINSSSLYGVSELSLTAYNLEGSLPEQIEDLVNLTEIYLGVNTITGTLPSGLFSLNLTVLSLSNNYIQGKIPDKIGNYHSLEQLYLDYNLFSSTLPVSIGNLTSLIVLDVTSNKLNGTLPNSFQSLKSLVSLDVSKNQLSGTLPHFLRQLTILKQFSGFENHFFGSLRAEAFPPHLIELNVANNSFTGELPLSFGSKDIVVLSIPFNGFYGTISDNLVANLTSASAINLAFNFFRGNIENTFSPISNLTGFEVNHNYFSGSIPILSIPRYYGADNNFFAGELPFHVKNSSTMYAFLVSDNFLSGRLELWNSVPEIINASYNAFSGNLSLITATSSDLGPQLFALVLNHNYFTGPLPFFPYVYILEVGDNQLTGTLPEFSSDLFLFSAPTNCFQGSLPKSFCTKQRNLTVAVLNGLSSATDCQIPLFPGTSFHTFILDNTFTGGIPDCYFSLPKLQILELSGNGLTGKLSDNITISSSLGELVLSHNLFSGTIPPLFQNKKWKQLDLSYNSFGGELFNSFHSYSSEATLTLTNNHLSGDVPESILDAVNIDILSGNLFYCNYDTTSLPGNDPSVDDYSCGSDLVNVAIYFWLAICTLFILLTFFFLSFRKRLQHIKIVSNLQRSIEKLVIWRSHFNTYCEFEYRKTNVIPTDENMDNLKWNEIVLLWIFNRNIRRTACLLSFFIFLVLLPSYVVLSSKYSSYQNEYAWGISGLFLNGVQSGFVLSVELFLFLLVITLTMICIWIYKFSLSPFRIWKNPELFIGKETKSLKEIEENKMNSLEVVTFAVLGLFNFIIMMLTDIAYVYCVINYNTAIIILAEFVLAVTKIVWNNFLLWDFVVIFHREMAKFFIKYKLGNVVIRDWKKFSHQDIAFLSWNIGLNNLIYPAIAILVVSSNCFYNVFYEAPAVTSSLGGELNAPSSAYTIYISVKSSYVPPYTYSYQCSSEIYTYYCPVFILMLVFETILIPVAKLILQYVARRYIVEDEEDGIRAISMQKIELVQNRAGEERAISTQSDQSVVSTQTVSKPNPEKNVFRGIVESLLHRFLLQFSDRQKDTQLFNKNRYVVRFNSYLLILVAYGAVFPPLALIVCFSVILQTIWQEIIIGRLLYKSQSKQISWYENQLKIDCAGMMDPIKYSLAVLIPISALLFSYLIFDTFGRKVYWADAFIPVVVIVLFSIMVVIFSNIQFKRAIKSKRKNERASVIGEEIEMVENPMPSRDFYENSKDDDSKDYED
jgi:Leucine-rich repeat (LRR) protein